MKRYLSGLFALVVVLTAICASFIKPLSANAYSSAAVSACNKIELGGSPGDIKSCEIGYDGAVKGQTQKQACPDSMGVGSRDPNSLSQAQCNPGWVAGKGAGSTIPQPPSGGGPGKNACSKAETGSNTAISACEVGYNAASQGKNQNQVQAICSAFGVGNAAECMVGFDLEKGIPLAGGGTRSGSGGGGGSTSTTTKQVGCDFQFDNPLTWIVCPVVSFLSDFINNYDAQITNQLDVKTDAIFCDNTDTCKAYYTAWQSFRDIALGLMVVVGLIILIAQALGLEILDAYTVRKVLPRLLVAAIIIVLSWPLMRFMINLSDDLGFGIRHLIYAPFASLSDTGNLDFGNAVANFFLGGGVAVVGGIAAWVEFGGLGALILFALSAALAVAVAIAVLILRQVVIILMVLLAPIAIIAYVLPNTQRIYRLWWESFSRALLMFPLIAALIATGRVFSAITFHNGGIFNQLIGFIAYFAPYFMIPSTFRMAGAAMSGIGNFVTSRAQPGFAALSKKRGETRAARHKAARTSGLYRNAFGKFRHLTEMRRVGEHSAKTLRPAGVSACVKPAWTRCSMP
jgi:hypothetical protein